MERELKKAREMLEGMEGAEKKLEGVKRVEVERGRREAENLETWRGYVRMEHDVDPMEVKEEGKGEGEGVK